MESTAQAIISVLENEEIEYVFGYPGGRVIELFEELPTENISVVRPRDEREASVMAEMHGRLTSSPAVLMGQGPWIGSLGSIGQMEARLGSSPMVVITEASERGDYSTLAPYQQARGDYGGLDLQSILDGITKEHWFPRTPAESIRSVQLAIKHAKAGRPGPTAVILDGNAVTEKVPENPTPQVWETTAQTQIWEPSPTSDDVEEAITALQAADRPVIIAGNGVHQAQAYELLEGVARTYNAIVVTSYLGKSTIAETHPLAAGVIGSFGHEGANQVVSEADTILVVGCRLNPMDTNWQAPSFIRPDEQTIIHADIDARNAGWVYPADVGLIGDASETLSALVQKGSREANGWAKQRATEARTSFTTAKCSSDARPIKPQRAVQEIQEIIDTDSIVTADSGNNRFWLLNYLQIPAIRTYFGSGGVGGMGWAMPAAVSASLITDQDVFAVAGDGGFTMTMTSVETAVEHGVDPVFIILNDQSLGMVRQMDPAISGVEFQNTDFVKIARGFGAQAQQVHTPGAFRETLRDAKESDTAYVIDVRIDRNEDMAAQLKSSFYEEVGGLHE